MFKLIVISVFLSSAGPIEIDRRITTHVNGGECNAQLSTMKLDAGAGATIQASCEPVK